MTKKLLADMAFQSFDFKHLHVASCSGWSTANENGLELRVDFEANEYISSAGIFQVLFDADGNITQATLRSAGREATNLLPPMSAEVVAAVNEDYHSNAS